MILIKLVIFSLSRLLSYDHISDVYELLIITAKVQFLPPNLLLGLILVNVKMTCTFSQGASGYNVTTTSLQSETHFFSNDKHILFVPIRFHILISHHGH